MAETKDVAVVVKQDLWTPEGFTQKGVDLLKKSIAKDATDIELQMFLHLCNQYHLDRKSTRLNSSH